MSNKDNVTLMVGLLIVVLNVLFFVIYFALLGVALSVEALIFIVFGSISYFLLLHFIKNVLWQIVCHLILTLFYCWTLINFAYFQIFGVFLELTMGHAAALKISVLTLLKDFVFLIPGKLYLITALIWLAVIGNALFYIKISKAKIQALSFNSASLEIISRRQPRKFRFVMVWVVLFAAVNFAAFTVTAYLVNNPKSDWWDVSAQAADLGVWGNLYAQPYNRSNKFEFDLNSNEPPVELSREIYQALGKLHGVAAAALPLPRFERAPNIVMVQLESTALFAVNNEPSPMPFLKKLMQDNATVGEFYSNSCETINAEFSALCSFWPDVNKPVNYSYQNNRFNCLPQILENKHGYASHFFHANSPDFWDRDIMLPAWGFENIHMTPEIKQKADDRAVFEYAVDVLATEPQPFFAYITTFTGHSPHNQELIDYHLTSNQLTIEPFSRAINSEYQNIEISENELRLYFGFLTAVDQALAGLFEKLRATGLADNTVVFIFNDHRYYNFSGDELADFYYYNQQPMTIVLPQKQTGQIQVLASQLDLAPTVLNLIEQDGYQPPEHFIGTSLYSAEFPNTVFNKCLGQTFFINPELIVRGNAQTDNYHLFHSRRELTEIERRTWLDLAARLTKISDETIKRDQLIYR